jgi:hypothetical protein
MVAWLRQCRNKSLAKLSRHKLATYNAEDCGPDSAYWSGLELQPTAPIRTASAHDSEGPSIRFFQENYCYLAGDFWPFISRSTVVQDVLAFHHCPDARRTSWTHYMSCSALSGFHYSSWWSNQAHFGTQFNTDKQAFRGGGAAVGGRPEKVLTAHACVTLGPQ